MSDSILVCTLGASWAIVPEVYAFLAPDALDLYRHHPRASDFARERERYGLGPPGDVWLATTAGAAATESITRLRTWLAAVRPPARFRVWIAERTRDLTTAQECGELQELILRLCLHANSRASQVVLSLAGGRKTMSADLQRAGSLFGCTAMLHVVGPDVADSRLKDPASFHAPLPAELAESLFPVVVAGRTSRQDFVDFDRSGFSPLEARDFPIGEPGAGEAATEHFRELRWRANPPLLAAAVAERERNALKFAAVRIETLLAEDRHNNWIGLYALPARRMDELRHTRVCDKHREWLRTLPKADLHLHVGGILDLPAQRAVAFAVWDGLTAAERQRARERVRPLLDPEPWPDNWPALLGEAGAERTAAAAAVLTTLDETQLETRLFEPTRPRIALRDRHALGFTAYERPGELSGSALLGRESAVAEYARQAYRILRREGVRYCELRGSPHKYLAGRALRFLDLFARALRKCAADEPGTEVRFIVTIDRRLDDEKIAAAVKSAVKAHASLGRFVVGLDVSGDERASDFDRLARLLEPAFEACLPVTIHAGEGEAADSIWSAAYRLHAQRVGHGLTLDERPDLIARLRDRGTALEMCPTSNLEVVGFRHPDLPDTQHLPAYPLRYYWHENALPVVICTDNPGISRTSLASEYIQAAALCGGLTLWEALAMIRSGFTHAFAPSEDRARLLQEADREIFSMITRNANGVWGGDDR